MAMQEVGAKITADASQFKSEMKSLADRKSVV